MRLWDWALSVYPRPGVEAACLALQDQHGVNVCYLLWVAWGEAEGRALDLAAGRALAVDWEGEVAQALRAARRALKPARAGVGDAARQALRGELKRLELSAERLLLESLEALPPGEAPAALEAAAAAWPSPPPAEAVAAFRASVTNPVYADGRETGA